jgi:hypothetical protein
MLNWVFVEQFPCETVRLRIDPMSKTTAETMTELVRERMSEWGDHGRVHALHLDDPANMTVAVGIRCNACGSTVRSSIPLRRVRSGPPGQAVMEEFVAAIEAFMREVPPSCEEARRLGIVRYVMES